MNGSRTKHECHFPQIWTWMEDSIPRNLTPAVMFCLESDVKVEHAQTIHLNPHFFLFDLLTYPRIRLFRWHSLTAHFGFAVLQP